MTRKSTAREIADKEDAEYKRIVQREATERVDSMLHALSEQTGWAEVHRHAHTLAGIVGEIDPRIATVARSLVGTLQDPYGRVRDLTPAEEAKARAEIKEIETELARITET